MPADSVATHVDAHFQDLENQDHAGHFGMWVFISSEILFFAGLFMLYTGYRSEYHADFSKAAEYAKVGIGTANTFILLTSSLFVAISVGAIREGRVRLVIVMQVLTILCGVAFMVLKGIEYFEHFSDQIYPGYLYHFEKAPNRGSGLFYTLYFVMTGLHALHVIVGIGLFVWLLTRTIRGVYSAVGHLGIELVGIYWHFVDVVWIFLWPMFYLLK
jgi:cytochrome c oxidase subunit 3